MPKLEFVWDEKKNRSNIKKHGVSFETAQYVFNDPLYMEKYDALHSIFEDRWKVIGFYNEFITVIAKFLPGDTARIISAWKSKPLEIEEYKNG